MASSDMVFSWRKSSRSGGTGQCVELGWRKSSHSGESGHCVELARSGAVRDSKRPRPILSADLRHLLTAVKAGRFDI
jgi:Domain of unknown function (DUF397)